MRKSDINVAFRDYVRSHLSPTADERKFVSAVYEAVQNVLAQANCLQIGSYPRFTSVSPIHDLDVLYNLGAWKTSPDPSSALAQLESTLKAQFKNPTGYTVKIARQTHSVTIGFVKANSEEVFAVDVVPAYVAGKNEFGDATYVVPELLSRSHGARKRLYEQISKGTRKMTWIASDPRGYITMATRVNQRNDDFRKAVKFVKGWRNSCKDMDDDFPLKAFHIEQIITGYFSQDESLEIFDAIFKFFTELPDYLFNSRIPDRADSNRKIDSYVDQLSRQEKALVTETRDHFLIGLEAFEGDVGALLEAGMHRRVNSTEEYLFDQKIPVLIEDQLAIHGRALHRQGSFRERILDALGLIEIDRHIEFRLAGKPPHADLFKWKVKNDDQSDQPRGEITDHRTKNDPEHTKFRGSHFVECYAIRDGVCIARARQPVVLR